MPKIARILLGGLVGAVICAVLSFLMFFLLTVFDNQKLIEAFAYGLIVAVIGAFVGAVIGLGVGIGDLSMAWGAVTGLLITLFVVAIYVYSTAESFARYGHFLSESRIIILVLSLPTLLTGGITALLLKKLTRASNQINHAG
jgi:uncharacterized membrane protein YjfL (UPF0719 family)